MNEKSVQAQEFLVKNALPSALFERRVGDQCENQRATSGGAGDQCSPGQRILAKPVAI